MNNESKFTPDMEALKAELGRVPPPGPKTKPEDFAPKKVRNVPEIEPDGSPDEPGPWKHLDTEPDHLTIPEVELAQSIKALLRDNKGWARLTAGEREALDLIASEFGRICAGRDCWDEIKKWVVLGSLYVG
jgi:hypothetical protein